jgi:hypothetical protein
MALKTQQVMQACRESSLAGGKPVELGAGLYPGNLIPWHMRDSSVRSGIFIATRPNKAPLKLRQERHVSGLDGACPDMPLLTELGPLGASGL